jgi:UDP-N-acetylglucosamine 2-epimerase (non-hydrolysing)
VGREITRLRTEITRILAGKAKRGRRPDLWDGRAGERIADCLLKRSESVMAATAS